VSPRIRIRSAWSDQADRPAVLGVVVAAALAGLLFGPVFGPGLTAPVVRPIAVVAVVTYCCYELACRWPRFERWRPWVNVPVGLFGVVETTLHASTANSLPTAASVRALYHGGRDSWLLTLQSTWPARPDPGLVVFVPLLVLAAAVLGVQMVTRAGSRLAALLPSLAVAGLAQGYHPLSGSAAVLAGIGFAALGAVIVTSGRWSAIRGAAYAAVLAVLAILVGTFAGSALDPAGRPAYSLQRAASPASIPMAITNPLDEIAYRLEHPQQLLFSDRAANADRWPIAVLDRFDGTNWTSNALYRRLGARLEPSRPAGVPSSRSDASITIDGLAGPWLPSQHGLESASGIEPLVDEATGSLLYGQVRPGLQYRLRWSSPQVPGPQLAGAGVVPGTAAAANSGVVPAAITVLARTATGAQRPSFRAALLLERYLRQHYRRAAGAHLPAGHGWPQIVHFLDPGNRDGGTSEQFATAYVVLARAAGIPARLVVGFRQPSQAGPDGSYVVRNGDMFAWPEVAVQGAGWVPLDPSGTARGAGRPDDQPGLAEATDQARNRLPPPDDIGPPAPTPTLPPGLRPGPAAAPAQTVQRRSLDGFFAVVAAAALACLLAWLLGVPVAKSTRRALRRRRTGAAGVLAAWFEARDRLRDHGVAVEPGMTVRDVAIVASHEVIDTRAARAIVRLGALLDVVLWSGAAVDARFADDAWRASGEVRHSLARRPITARLLAAVTLRGLLRPQR
jgi:hypothetical protein